MRRKYVSAGLILISSMSGCYTGIETRPRDLAGYYPDKREDNGQLIGRYKTTCLESDLSDLESD